MSASTGPRGKADRRSVTHLRRASDRWACQLPTHQAVGPPLVFPHSQAARSQQHRVHTERRPRLAEPPVQRAEGGAMIGANREM